MKKGYFITGFPGFISNQLIREILQRNGTQGVFYALVLPSTMKQATEERTRIMMEFSLDPSQFELIEGDITVEHLGIDSKVNERIKSQISHIFHLAAIYDLAVPKHLAYKVNVNGTKNVNDWVMTLPRLERYTYFSTAYVAGTREGKLYEDELVRPESFKNYYEETKYEAELLVEAIKQEVPVTIIRPGIVKGHSQTGETIKFDGPYFILNFLDRLKFLPFLPFLGKSEAVVNLVPVDYIIRSTTYLSFLQDGAGKTYHLTDPKPYRVRELYEMLMTELLKKRPVGTLPLSVAKLGLAIKPLRKYLGVEKESLDYFTWLGYFDCTNAKNDLMGSGIECPDFKDGIPAMIAFYEKHKQNPVYQVKII